MQTNQKHLAIGGIQINISCDSTLKFDPYDAAYTQFFSDKSLQNHPDRIDVTVNSGLPPCWEDMDEIFDNCGYWKLFKDKDSYWLYVSDNQEPYKWLHANLDFSRLTFTLHEKYKNSQYSISPLLNYPVDQVVLMHYLNNKGGVIVHSSGIVINEEGYVFVGVSGAGKSTISRLFLERDKVSVLSDDRIIIRNNEKKGNYTAWGTPWLGDANIAENAMAPLKGIFFLKQSLENKIVSLDPAEAVRRILPMTSAPWYDAELVTAMFEYLSQLMTTVPVNELYFRADEDSVSMVQSFVSVASDS